MFSLSVELVWAWEESTFSSVEFVLSSVFKLSSLGVVESVFSEPSIIGELTCSVDFSLFSDSFVLESLLNNEK